MTGRENFIQAPFTDEQVDALNRYQHLGYVHPFTCPNHSEKPEADRSLFATTKGWVCGHCNYTQDWAHRAMVEPHTEDAMPKLPCDVMLPPATLIRRGCSLETLLTGIRARVGEPPESMRFEDPAPKPDVPIEVRSSDYSYDGRLAGLAIKKSGAVRYIVEDENRRLFIHNHIQIGKPEGWRP